MKKRNLFLSLICSIILTVALATFTIVSVVSPKKQPNNGGGDVSEQVSQTNPQDVNANRDGSSEKPYLLYDANSFVTLLQTHGYTEVKPVKVPVMVDALDENGDVILDADGNAVKTEKLEKVDVLDANGDPILDEQGNKVQVDQVVMTDKLDENGDVVYNDTCYFELASDIDFAGVNYVTLFNQDKAFNGHLNGKGFALNNVSINVNKENLDAFAYQNNDNKGRYDANIALFGKVKDAEIIDVKLNNIAVNVADEVYDYVDGGAFYTDHNKNAMNDIKVATLAAQAENSTIKAEVSGQVNAGAYTLVLSNLPENNGVLGGLVGLAVRTTIENSKVSVKITTSGSEADASYFVGGIAGQAYYSDVKNVEVDLDVLTSYEKAIDIGGAFGYMVDVDLADARIDIDVQENKARGSFGTIGTYGFDYTQASWIAGIAPRMKAAKNEVINVSNVKVYANVAIDAVYGGVVVEVDKASVAGNVNFKNVIVSSDVNTLEAFGFARYLGVATVAYDEDAFEVDANNNAYNVRLVGNVILRNTQDCGNGSTDPTVAKGSITVSAFEKTFITAGKGADLKLVVSNSIYNALLQAEKWVVNRLTVAIV